MTPSESGRVRAEQLIYTNVEADLSPTRQRGFQVWLGSPAWTTEQKRDIARRLDNFRLPVGAAATDATLARHIYFPTADGLFVIARTVPLVGKDKFGRGGRFHAHALVLTEDEFARVGFNPFRVLDGGFAFHNSPDEAMAVEGWRSGSLPPVDLVVTDPTPVDASIPPDRLRAIVAHLERGEDRPLVLAIPPGGALAAFHALFAWLPPSARRGIVFDTLWTGEPNSQTRCHLAGGYSADNVRTWASRRYVRLALPDWETQPALESPGDELPTRLLADSRWGDLDDRDRDAAYRVGRALAARRVGSADVADLAPAALAALDACAAVPPAIAEAIQARINRDLDPAVKELPEVGKAVNAYFAGPRVDQLDKLSRPIPNELADDAVRATLRQSDCEPPSELLDYSDKRLGNTDLFMRLVVARWRGNDADLSAIERALKSPPGTDDPVLEFRDWAIKTLKPEFQNPGPKLLEKLQPCQNVPAETLRDVRLYLALQVGVASSERTKFKFLTAYHRGSGPFKRLIQMMPQETILASRILDYIPQVQVRLIPGWRASISEPYFLGIQLIPYEETDARLLDLAAWAAKNHNIRRPCARLLYTLIPTANPSRTDVHLREIDLIEEVSRPTKTLCEALLSAAPEKLNRAAEVLQTHLRSVADDEEFRRAANKYLFTRAKKAGSPAILHNDSGALFLGFQLDWTQRDKLSHYQKLFEAVADSVVPEFGANDGRKTGVDGSLIPRRFIWMLARLGDVAKTGRWLV